MFNNNNENSFEFLDVLTILGFYMQVTQIQNSNKHMQEIEDKLDLIIKKLGTVDEEVIQALNERKKYE